MTQPAESGAWATAATRCAVLAWVLTAVAALGVSPVSAAGKEDRVFTVGNYPVEAKAANAVAAKDRAIADGQQAAFRSLLRRIVPTSAYNRIPKMRAVKAADLIEGISVRSERNSPTEYIASYDFSFQGEAVRRILDREGIPFLDRQAPAVVVIPVYQAPGGAGVPEVFTETRGSDAWLYAWKSLDLTNALAPVNLQAAKRELHADTVAAILNGDQAAIRTAGAEYRTEALLIAHMVPDLAAKRVTVTLAGRDAVAPFVLRRSHRLDGPDIAFTAEAAAVLALGILEGRWKAINVRSAGSGAVAGSGRPIEQPQPVARPGPEDAPFPGRGGSDAMKIAVEFRSMGEWQEISRQLARTPEVTDLDVEGLSSRGARITLRYPGGPENLAAALAAHGLTLRSAGSGWVLSQR
jgi:hypothetical protein